MILNRKYMCHILKTYSLFISFTYAYGIILGVQIKIGLRYQFLNLPLKLIRISLISYIDYWNNSRAMHNLRRGSLM